MSPSRRGMTLMELVVYCLLLGLFSGMLFLALPGRTNDTLDDLEEATVRAGSLLNRLTLEVTNSSAGFVAPSDKPPGVTFLSATEGEDAVFSYTGGDIAWRGWVGYFQEDSSLMRYWLPFKTPRARNAVATHPTLAALRGGTAREVSRDLENFSARPVEPGLWSFTVTIRVAGSIASVQTVAGPRN